MGRFMGIGKTARRRGRWSERGQATVELAVVLPVAIVVAVVAVNALAFFGTCASFDRVARQAICTWGAAPAASQEVDVAAQQVRDELERVVGAPHVSVSVRSEAAPQGLTTFTARLEYLPTLFGLGLRHEIFGVPLPPLVHEVTMAVDVYRPGVLF